LKQDITYCMLKLKYTKITKIKMKTL